jgi:hypothetical protein
MPARRSSGGTEGEGVQSYTATVLHAAKSFGKGLRELGETVASSLTGGATGLGMQRGMVGGVAGPVAGHQGGNIMSGNADSIQPGIVTILDAQVHLICIVLSFRYHVFQLSSMQLNTANILPIHF